MRVKNTVSNSTDGFNEKNPTDPLPKISRIIVDENFLFITLTRNKEKGFQNEYHIHSPDEHELLRVIAEEPVIQKMWILELGRNNWDELANFSEIEAIERCESTGVPNKLTTIFMVKGQERYIQYDGPLKDKPLLAVYTLAKFS